MYFKYIPIFILNFLLNLLITRANYTKHPHCVPKKFLAKKLEYSFITSKVPQYSYKFGDKNNFSELYAKGARVIVTLECTEAKKLGVRPSRYVTTKNKLNTPGRLQLMKYNRYARKHTLHKEIK